MSAFTKPNNVNVTHCNTLKRTATYFNVLQHTAGHCYTLQHTATHCTHTATLSHTSAPRSQRQSMTDNITHCNTLHPHCNTLPYLSAEITQTVNDRHHYTLQHTATHCTHTATLSHTSAPRSHRQSMTDTAISSSSASAHQCIMPSFSSILYVSASMRMCVYVRVCVCMSECVCM